MILIISSDTDITTNDVIDWLKYYDVNFKRVSDKNEIIVKDLTITSNSIHFVFEINGEIFDFNEIKSIWYRRSRITLKFHNYTSGIDTTFDRSVIKQLDSENKTIHQLVWDLFKLKSINNEYDNTLNKLRVLHFCKELNIRIPKSIITSSKSVLKKFKEETGSIITKNANQGVFLEFKDTSFMPFTTKVSKSDIESLPEYFPPMFFQKMIKKSFELRVYYREGKFYSSAIFSQNDSKTKLDFRNYNYKKPNRTPPYKLPLAYELLLNRLMKRLGLNSGSIDLLVDKKGTYHFLEVNPIGQFTQVSYPCNYYLEKELAQRLIQ